MRRQPADPGGGCVFFLSSPELLVVGAESGWFPCVAQQRRHACPGVPSLGTRNTQGCSANQKHKWSRALVQLLISIFCRIVTLSSSEQQRRPQQRDENGFIHAAGCGSFIFDVSLSSRLWLLLCLALICWRRRGAAGCLQVAGYCYAPFVPVERDAF